MPADNRFYQRPLRASAILAVTVLLAACSNETTSTEPAQQAPAPDAPQAASPAPATVQATPKEHEFKPEMLVRFPASAPICESKEALQAYMVHGVKGEDTKLQALFTEQNGEHAPCFMVKPTAVLKVIGVEYNDPTIEVGLLEVAPKDTVTSEGVWAFTLGAEAVPSHDAASKR